MNNFFRPLIGKAYQSVLRRYQAIYFDSIIKKNTDVIIMIVPEEQLISGGILSIFSFYYETKKIKNSAVFICTYANSRLIYKYNWFNNSVPLISLDIILNSNHRIDNLLIHIPEYYVEVFPYKLTKNQINKIKSIHNVHINIMNQNNELMVEPRAFIKLRELCNKLTITTAHSSYTTADLRYNYDAPVHLLSAWFEQSSIVALPYNKKENIMIVSPDEHPMKEKILNKIQKELPHIRQIIIKNMRYDNFKKLESIAKWSISFGEGFDGYTIFPMLKGGIGFAVYNDTFFDVKYKGLQSFYESYSALYDNIVSDIVKLDDEKKYNATNLVARDLLSAEYSYELYAGRVRAFYNEQYTIQ